MNFNKYILAIVFGVLSSSVLSYVGPSHVVGEIKNITSTKSGLMVKIGNNEVPENCTSGQTWMLIEETNSTMISVTLASWAMGRNLAVYTTSSASGYCKINQVDPAES